MDGFKSKLNYSIQYRLSFWIAIIIILMAVISVIISYSSALHEAREIQDEGLKQIGFLVQKNQRNITLNNEMAERTEIIIQYIPNSQTSNQAHEFASPSQLKLPSNLSDGLQTLLIDNIKYRVLKLTLVNQQQVVIGQQTILRDEAAISGAVSTALPMLLLLPVLIAVAYLLIRNAFRPVTALSESIDRRSAEDLTSFSEENMPSEVLPFIRSINFLFHKVNQSAESQRRFIADAAHELRSPLTALSLQAERLVSAEMTAIAVERLATLRQGITRASVLLEQLLSFAKAQRLNNVEAENLSVHQTLLKVLADLIPLAEAKSLNVGVKSAIDAIVKMNEADLICLIKNLIDNAIRYTPDGGQIDLSISKELNDLVLEIEDSGHGIPEAERARVFDAFYRILGNDSQGSGLGLSIVKSILLRAGGRIALLDSDSFVSGLKVKIYLPLPVDALSA
ncbi:ATP-binding protein [Methylotenera sp.]|uniref:ATP-binding protein n=1 Tax=Methylotenera sp. TaxID=2051956 RepID=UPI0024878909|nr:ATP-binding protein [Methylotenera sp.]MDI1300006.1 ATP-binding protein [Methylotenera sp.]